MIISTLPLTMALMGPMAAAPPPEATALAQATGEATSQAKAPAADLSLPPYETYTLENGLKVLLMEDHSLPRVVVDTWFGVGSYDDPQGASGFAHLFEHLMFMGTTVVPQGKFDATMEAAGARNNASTGDDRRGEGAGPCGLYGGRGLTRRGVGRVFCRRIIILRGIELQFRRKYAGILQNAIFYFLRDVRIIPQERFGVFPALPDSLVAEREPGA